MAIQLHIHSLLRRHSTASTSTAFKLSFATFIFDGQSNVVVQMSRFLCVNTLKNQSSFEDLILVLFFDSS